MVKLVNAVNSQKKIKIQKISTDFLAVFTDFLLQFVLISADFYQKITAVNCKKILL